MIARWRWVFLGFLTAGLLLQGSWAENPPKDGPDPKAVHAAIDKGVKYLLTYYDKHPLKGKPEKELILYALLHGGVKPNHPIFERFIPELQNEAPRNTYNVAIAMMLFHRLDPAKFKAEIARGAAFLVQNQSANGQWGYSGTPVPLRTDYPVYEREAPYMVYDVGKSKDKDKGDKERVIARRLKGYKIPPQTKALYPDGDNSNMQYGLLGLRAAAESGCLIPEEVWVRSYGWIKKAQGENGGFNYGMKGRPEYTHTMATAGIAMATICKFYMKPDPNPDTVVGKALEWLGSNFSVDHSTCVIPGDSAHYYYLYGLERAGALANVEQVGGHDWYSEGAKWLVSHQGADGSWKDPDAKSWASGALTPEIDTAFAVLFLKRSTLPLVPLDKRKEYEVGEAK